MSGDRSLDGDLARLEDVLASYDYDRALPPLEEILAAAGVSRDLLHDDDRAMKLLHEAIVARPLSSLDAVAETRTEVELLTLEVSVLTDRLQNPDADPAEIRRVIERLQTIRERLDELTGLL